MANVGVEYDEGGCYQAMLVQFERATYERTVVVERFEGGEDFEDDLARAREYVEKELEECS